MRIDHGALINVSTDVDEHRWHAGNALADVAAVANAGAAWDDPDAPIGRQLLHWKRRFVEPRLARRQTPGLNARLAQQ